MAPFFPYGGLALADFDKEEDCELSFKNGEQLLILDERDDGWLVACVAVSASAAEPRAPRARRTSPARPTSLTQSGAPRARRARGVPARAQRTRQPNPPPLRRRDRERAASSPPRS